MLFGPNMVWIAGAGVLFFMGIFVMMALFSRQILFLSGRNIFRNTRRTTISVMVVCFGVTGMMMLCGFIENSFATLREATITSGTGHFQIYKKGFNEKSVIDKSQYCIDNYEEIKKMLKEDPVIGEEIKTIAASLDFTGLVASSETSSMCMGRGVEVEHDQLLSSFDRLVDGEPLSKEGVVDEGMVGKGLSTAIGAKLGDVLTILVVTKTGTLNAIDMSIRGIIQGAAKEYDDTILKLSLKHAQRLMGRKDISKIVVLLNKTEQLPKVVTRIEEIIKSKQLDLEYRTWQDLSVLYAQVHEIYRGIFLVFLFIIVVVVVLSILNTMTMSVMERVREIGTLRAMGSSRKEISKIFLTEGLILGVLGAITSFLITLLLVFLLNHVKGGIDMPPPPGRTFGYQAYFDVLQNPWICFFGFNVSMLTTLLSSIMPAHKASKMDIVEALRHY